MNVFKFLGAVSIALSLVLAPVAKADHHEEKAHAADHAAVDKASADKTADTKDCKDCKVKNKKCDGKDCKNCKDCQAKKNGKKACKHCDMKKEEGEHHAEESKKE